MFVNNIIMMYIVGMFFFFFFFFYSSSSILSSYVAIFEVDASKGHFLVVIMEINIILILPH